jgi:hypothetical protein
VHQPSSAKGLQVLGDVGDRQAELRGQKVDAARTLCELLDQLQPLRMAERLRHRRELRIESLLRIPD